MNVTETEHGKYYRMITPNGAVAIVKCEITPEWVEEVKHPKQTLFTLISEERKGTVSPGPVWEGTVFEEVDPPDE